MEDERSNRTTVGVGRTFNDWEFQGPDGSCVVRVSGSFESNSAAAVYHAALAGLGIARLAMYLVGSDVKAGRLVRVLPAHVHEKASILAVYPHRRHLSPRVRSFVDFLVEKFTPLPPWKAD